MWTAAIVTLVLVAAAIVLRPVVVQSQASRCSAPFRLENKSFKRLPGTRLAYVWVDDIQSKLFGGFDPFEIFIVIGQAYSPFQAASGSLDRAAFMRLTQNTYNARRQGPLRVNPQSRTPARLDFTDGKRRFSLEVTDVQTSSFGHDAAVLRLCR